MIKRVAAVPEAIRIILYSKLWTNFIQYAIEPTLPPIN